MFAPSGWALKKTEVYLWDLSQVFLSNKLFLHDLDYWVCISGFKLMLQIVL